jgi:hypothetical protein
LRESLGNETKFDAAAADTQNGQRDFLEPSRCRRSIVRAAFFHPLTPLLLFALISSALLTTYRAVGMAPSPSFEMSAGVFWGLLLAFWVVADARHRTGVPCFDFGFLCWVFLPIAVPWYCFWSRGWRGSITLGVIACLWLAHYVVARIIWQMLYE